MQPENTGGEIPNYIGIMSMGKLTYCASCSSVFWVMCFLWPGDFGDFFFFLFGAVGEFVLWGLLRVAWTL